jgi:hypothetical protein
MGAEAFRATCNQTRAVDERGTGHGELDLATICDSIEEADEVRFIACEAGICGGRADLRYADWAAGEGCEQQARYEVAVACEVERLLEGFVDGHAGRCGRRRLVSCAGE